VSGRPHPGSDAEQRLEMHLAQQQWAHSRRWNQPVETGTLEPYVRADLVWHDVGLVVEIDGADHRTKTKYADDRRRDIALQLAGYTVLRFTNDQVLSDTTWVAAIIEKLHNRRLAAKELP
jgi:very-short-patch-repair endonuclease